MQLIALWALSYIQFSFQTTIATQPAHIISLNQSKYRKTLKTHQSGKISTITGKYAHKICKVQESFYTYLTCNVNNAYFHLYYHSIDLMMQCKISVEDSIYNCWSKRTLWKKEPCGNFYTQRSLQNLGNIPGGTRDTPGYLLMIKRIVLS